MALFSSFKIAPGVRISTSGRGLRAHVGPRVARVHVGGGRSGVSTGAGPFTMYSGLGANQRSRPRSASTNGMTAAQAERARQLDENAQAWRTLTELHRIDFPDAAHPGTVAADPVPVFAVLLARAEKRHLATVGRFDREGRRQARALARTDAEVEAMELLDAGMRDWNQRQDASDDAWSRLVDGQPDAVVDAVHAALVSRGVSAAVTSDRVGHVRLALRTSLTEEDVPSHQSGLTTKGAPTLKKLTKTETAQHVRQLLAARVLLAAKETVAQSPAIGHVDVVVARGRDEMVRAHLTRDALVAAPWQLTAWQVLEAADPMLEANIGGRTQELRPLK